MTFDNGTKVAKGVDPNQTAPRSSLIRVCTFGSSLIRVCTFCHPTNISYVFKGESNIRTARYKLLLTGVPIFYQGKAN